MLTEDVCVQSAVCRTLDPREIFNPARAEEAYQGSLGDCDLIDVMQSALTWVAAAATWP